MTKLNNSQLDDPVVVEACPSFVGGQRSFGPPDQLAPNEAAELLNVDIRDGTATTRRGTAPVGATLPGGVQGLAWYETASAAVLVACSNGGLERWDGAAWAPFSSYTAASPEALVCFAQFDETLYIADGASHLCAWDGAVLSDLGSGGDGQPPVGGLVLSSANRLWLAGLPSMPDALWASKPLDGHIWDATNGVLRIGAGEGGGIVGLAAWDSDQIVVFKRNSIHVVKADPALTSGVDEAHALSKATVTKISDTIGCVAQRTIARVGSDVWFLSEQGVYSIGRVLAQADRKLKEAVSGPVQDVLQRVHWGAADRAAAVYWDHRYLLALPLDGAASPSAVLVHHTQRKAWSGLWTGLDPVAWVLGRGEGHERLFFGREDGAVRRWLDDVPPGNEVESSFQDAGENIPTRITTRALTLGDALCEKSGLSLQVEFFGSQARASLAVRADEDEPLALQTGFATASGVLVLPIVLPAKLPSAGLKRQAFGTQRLPPFRTMQAVISAPAGKLALRSVTASGFLDTMRLEG